MDKNISKHGLYSGLEGKEASQRLGVQFCGVLAIISNIIYPGLYWGPLFVDITLYGYR